MASDAPRVDLTVCCSTRSGNFEVHTMHLDGTSLVRLTDHPAADRQPDWSPEGTRISFASLRDGKLDKLLAAFFAARPVPGARASS